MTREIYVAAISHCTPDGDCHLLASCEESVRRPLRVLRTKMKKLGRASGLPFYLCVFRPLRAPRKKPCTDHYFRCLAGRGRRRSRA